MQLGKHWRIESDEMNVTLLERGTSKKTGAETWTVKGYYSTPANALKGLVGLRIRRTNLKDLETVVAEIEKLKKLIDSKVRREL